MPRVVPGGFGHAGTQIDEGHVDRCEEIRGDFGEALIRRGPFAGRHLLNHWTGPNGDHDQVCLSLPASPRQSEEQSLHQFDVRLHFGLCCPDVRDRIPVSGLSQCAPGELDQV